MLLDGQIRIFILNILDHNMILITDWDDYCVVYIPLMCYATNS